MKKMITFENVMFTILTVLVVLFFEAIIAENLYYHTEEVGTICVYGSIVWMLTFFIREVVTRIKKLIKPAE